MILLEDFRRQEAISWYVWPGIGEPGPSPGRPPPLRGSEVPSKKGKKRSRAMQDESDDRSANEVSWIFVDLHDERFQRKLKKILKLLAKNGGRRFIIHQSPQVVAGLTWCGGVSGALLLGANLAQLALISISGILLAAILVTLKPS